jgi:hypothetical protein
LLLAFLALALPVALVFGIVESLNTH